MQLSKRNYPYPILNNNEPYNSYKNSTYELKYEPVEENDSYILKNIRIETNNEDLKYLLNTNKLKAIVCIDCSRTLFKLTEEIGLQPKDIVIKSNNLNGVFNIYNYVFPNENIDNFTSSDLDDDYSGYNFTLEKYSLFAVDESHRIKAEYDDTKDKKVASIFTLVKNISDDEKLMKIAYDERKIKIIIPKKEFDDYYQLKDNDAFNNIYFSLLIIPALSQCLNEIKYDVKNGDRDLDEIMENYSWFTSIQKAYKNITGKEFDYNTIIESDMLEVSQLLMNNCEVQSLTDFYNIIMNNKIEQEEE